MHSRSAEALSQGRLGRESCLWLWLTHWPTLHSAINDGALSMTPELLLAVLCKPLTHTLDSGPRLTFPAFNQRHTFP